MKERKPKSAEEAGKLADIFVQTRKSEDKEGEKKKSEETISGSCYTSGRAGHIAIYCKVKVPESSELVQAFRPERKDLREIECFITRRATIPQIV